MEPTRPLGFAKLPYLSYWGKAGQDLEKRDHHLLHGGHHSHHERRRT